MKLFALATLTLVISCGKIEKNGNSNLNRTRSFEPVTVGGDEASRIQRICQALSVKRLNLQTDVPTLKFEVSEKNCEGQMASPNLVPVKINIEDEHYSLKNSDGSNFIFKDVETDVSGVMGEICSRKESLTSPMEISGGNIIWFKTSGISVDDCKADSTGVCIFIETGVKDGETYRVRVEDYIRFELDPKNLFAGFFTQRKMRTSTFCAEGSSKEVRALLK